MRDEDIKRLLAGRQLLDDYAIEKAGIFADETKMAGERVEAHAKAYGRLEEALAALGFSSIAAFYQFNSDMNIQALQECRPVQGSCDLCVGNKDPMTNLETGPLCVKIWGCDPKSIEGLPYPAALYETMMARVRKNPDMFLTDKKIKVGCCPYPHGYYVDEALCKPLPFPVTWGIKVANEKRAVIDQLMARPTQVVKIKK